MSVNLVFVGVTDGHLSVVVVVVVVVGDSVSVVVVSAVVLLLLLLPGFGMSTGAEVACWTSAVFAVIVGPTVAGVEMGVVDCCVMFVAEPQLP